MTSSCRVGILLLLAVVLCILPISAASNRSFTRVHNDSSLFFRGNCSHLDSSSRVVFMIHGLLANASRMIDGPASWLEASPLFGSRICSIAVQIGSEDVLDSLFWSMDRQLDTLHASVSVAMTKLQSVTSITVLGVSQGSLLARAYVQRFGTWSGRIRQLVLWSGPQAGTFGIPFIDDKELTELLQKAPYSPYMQEMFSFAQYWKDPFALAEYAAKSKFLADINLDRPSEFASEYRERLVSLDRIVLIYSTVDEVIHPPESGWFGFFRENSDTELVPLQETSLWTSDKLGLRELYERNALVFLQSECKHMENVRTPCQRYFLLNIAPFLLD